MTFDKCIAEHDLSLGRSKPFPAQVCANCFVFNKLRIRSLGQLRTLVRTLIQEQELDFWSQRMVEALEAAIRLHRWRVQCNIERTEVSLLEPACCHFESKKQ